MKYDMVDSPYSVRRFMADCLSSLPEVAQDLFMHEQGVSRCALA